MEEVPEKRVFGEAKTFQSVVLSSQNDVFVVFEEIEKNLQNGGLNGMKIYEKSSSVCPLGPL